MELPLSARTIAQAAFAECKSLKTAKLNEGLEALGTDEYDNEGKPYYGVFEKSSVKRVKLPSTLRRIEYGAFENCKSLKSICLPDELEYIGKYCF